MDLLTDLIYKLPPVKRFTIDEILVAKRILVALNNDYTLNSTTVITYFITVILFINGVVKVSVQELYLQHAIIMYELVGDKALLLVPYPSYVCVD